MRHFLSAHDLRLISIIEILFYSDWVSLTQFSEKLDCSEKTVRNSLNTLATQYDHFQIETSPLLGYRPVEKDEYSIQNISTDIINQSLVFRTMEILLNESDLRLVDLEEKLYVSANSIRTVIANINAYFSVEDIQVENRPFEIVGNENKITSLFMTRYFEPYFRGNFKDHHQIPIIARLITQLEKENPVLKAAFVRNQPLLNLTFYIRILREKNGHGISDTSDHPQQVYQCVDDKEFRDFFFKGFGFPLTNELLNNIVNFALYEPCTPTYLQMTYLFPSTSEYQVIHGILSQLTTQVAKQLKIPTLSPSELQQMIEPMAMPDERHLLNFPLFDSLVQILTHEVRPFFAIASAHTPIAVYETYIVVELSYILANRWQALIDRLIEIETPMKLGVLYITNEAYLLLLEEMLSYQLPNTIDIEYLTYFDEENPHDLYLANYIGAIPEEHPVINIAALPNDTHINKIKEYYQQFRLEQYLNYR